MPVAKFPGFQKMKVLLNISQQNGSFRLQDVHWDDLGFREWGLG